MPTIIKLSGIFENLNKFREPAIKTVKEIMNVVETEAELSFNRQKSKTRTSTGNLISSFGQKPIQSKGATLFTGIVFAGGPSAPYAPIVEDIGWKTITGRKPGYHFMHEGALKGDELAATITIKNFSKVL